MAYTVFCRNEGGRVCLQFSILYSCSRQNGLRHGRTFIHLSGTYLHQLLVSLSISLGIDANLVYGVFAQIKGRSDKPVVVFRHRFADTAYHTVAEVLPCVAVLVHIFNDEGADGSIVLEVLRIWKHEERADHDVLCAHRLAIFSFHLSLYVVIVVAYLQVFGTFVGVGSCRTFIYDLVVRLSCHGVRNIAWIVISVVVSFYRCCP